MKKLSKKRVSKKNLALEQFSGTAVGALVEDFDSKLSVVAEDVLGMRKDVSGLHGDFTELKEDVSGLHEEVTELKEDVSGLHIKVDDISDELKTVKSSVVVIAGDLETVKSNIDIIKMDIEFIKYDLRKKVSYDDFASLEKRVALLESKI